MFFDNELLIWEDFRNTIEGIILEEGTKDQVIWALSNTERFTCRSFRRAIAREGEASDKGKLLWSFLVPLKVKRFGWLLLRDMLQFLGVIQEEEDICPICEVGREDSRHLSFRVIGFIKCGQRLQGCGVYTMLGPERYSLVLAFSFICLLGVLS